VARYRGSKAIRHCFTTPTKRLEGMIPVVEDWHTEVVILKVIPSIQNCISRSTSYCGTLQQLQNAIGWRNVKKEPKKDFDACQDFFTLIAHCHILCAAMEVLAK